MFFQRFRLRGKFFFAAAAVFLPVFCPPSPAAAAESSALTGNAENGKALFLRRCASCHYADRDKNKIGPSLRGVFGRRAGQTAGYHYSAAMKSAGEENLRWTAENLRAFLKSPRGLVPGTRMPPVLPRLSARETEDIIRYLAQMPADKTAD